MNLTVIAIVGFACSPLHHRSHHDKDGRETSPRTPQTPNTSFESSLKTSFHQSHNIATPGERPDSHHPLSINMYHPNLRPPLPSLLPPQTLSASPNPSPRRHRIPSGRRAPRRRRKGSKQSLPSPRHPSGLLPPHPLVPQRPTYHPLRTSSNDPSRRPV